MEIGRFSAVIGADPGGLSTGLRTSARQIEGFAKDTQKAFRRIGTSSGDLGAVGTRAGRQIVDAIKRELDAGTSILREFAHGVDITNVGDVRAVRDMVREHQALAAAAGASADELRQIAGVLHLIDGRQLGSAATQATLLGTAAGVAVVRLRTLGTAITATDLAAQLSGVRTTITATLAPLPALFRSAGRESARSLVAGIAGEVGAGSRALKQLSAGASVGVAVDSRGIRDAVSAQRVLLGTTVAVADEFQREGRAINGTVGAIAGSGNAARRALPDVDGLTAGLRRQIVALLTLQVAARALSAAFRASDDQERAARKLLATSKITGEAFQTISGFATRAQTDLQVSSGVAADLVQNLVKLTARAGETARTGDVLIRWMDLAAAQGLTLDEALQTIQTTLIGQDEGLNRLGLSNPQQIYERWGKAAGVSAAKMTDAQKAQAVLNAVVEAGTKVTGEYTRSLNTAAGRQQAFNLELTQTAAAFGRSLQGSRDFVTGASSGILKLIREVVELNDAIERTRGSWFRIMLGALTGGAAGFGREIAQAQADLDAALAKAKKDQVAAQRAFNQGPRQLRAPIIISGEDATEARAKEIALLKTLHGAEALRAQDTQRAKTLLKELTAVINGVTLSDERRAELESQRSDLRGILETKDATKDLRSEVEALVVAYGLAAGEAGRQQEIIPRLVAGYDRLNAALGAQKDQASATSNELRAQLATLRAFDPVIVGLARRQFRAVENIPEVPKLRATAQIVDLEFGDVESRERLRLSADLIDIRVPTNVKNAVQKSLSFRALPPIPIEIDPTFNPEAISLSFKNALSAARLAKADMGIAEAVGDQKALAKATDASAAAQARLKQVSAELAGIIRNSGLSDAAKAFGIESLDTAIRGTVGDTQSLDDKLRALTSSARGVLSTAEAIGLIGDNASRSLAEVINLVDAVAQLAKATSQGGQTFGKIGAILQAAGSLGNLIATIISNPEAKANREILKGNTAALAALRQDLAGFAQTPDQMLRAAAVIRDNAILTARRATDGFTRGFKNIEELDAQLRASGTSIAELKRRADELGISIVDAKGRITAQGLDALDKALQLAAERAVRFSKSFEDQSAAAALRRRVLGTTDPADVLRDSFAIFKSIAPKLASTFFDGIDTSTKAGREEFKRRMLKFVDEFIAGTIPVGDFGGLDRETIIGIVGEWVDQVDAMTDAARQAAGAMINIAEGAFNLNKRLGQVLGTSPTQFRDIIVPPLPNTVPIPVPIGGDSGSVSVSIDLGGITVVNEAGDTPEVLREKVRRAALDKARTISPEAVRAVQAVFPA